MSDQMKSEVNNENNEVHPEKLYRPEVIDMFVKAGIGLFCRDVDPEYKRSIKETNVSGWVFFEAQENKIRLGRAEFDEIVRKVYATYTGVLHNSPHSLTVGQLRNKLEGLPDNAPVYYQRIEDFYFEKNNWTTEKFVWDTSLAREGDVESVKANPSDDYDVQEKDGVTFIRHFSKYVPAFSAYDIVNDDGKMAFVLNAHY